MGPDVESLSNAGLTIAGDDARLLPSKEHNVNVCSQPDVKSQVPTHVVRIVIDHHLILVSQPVIAVVIVIGRDTEIIPPKPETAPAPARQSVSMPAS